MDLSNLISGPIAQVALSQLKDGMKKTGTSLITIRVGATFNEDNTIKEFDQLIFTPYTETVHIVSDNVIKEMIDTVEKYNALKLK